MESKFTFQELLNKHKIIIPQIQRDYAQGRSSEIDLRKGFISKIKQSFLPEFSPLNLDFIYGYTEKINNDNSAFIPLDGQQRLTTLWLIHWYLAPREINQINGINLKINSEEIQQLLNSFTYQTRISTKRFCSNLITNPLNCSEKDFPISELIKNAPWFMASWNNDPTIVSMLNMLNTIQEENFEKIVTWESLIIGRKLTFDYIDIKSDEFKLTDELYIKMNSRGKPLTSFENFKAQFSDLLDSKSTNYFDEKLVYQEANNLSYKEYFAFKIDGIWMDLFWRYRNEVSTTDNCFLNFIYYIAEYLYFKDNPNSISSDFKLNFDSLNKIFSIKKNVDFLFNSLDLLSELNDVEGFFNDLFSDISTFDNYPKDYFLRAITDTGFDVKDKTILYALLTYCIINKTKIVDEEIKYFIRIVRNQLLAVRQPNQSKRIEYSTNLRLTNVSDYTKFIDELVKLKNSQREKCIYEIFYETNLTGFSKDNISFEKEKASLIISNPKIKQILFSLEEHKFIQGKT